MIEGLKICGVSDLKTLNYIIDHPYPPQFIGFITNYKKSKRYVEIEKLKELINVDKKGIKFVSVLVNPDNEILEKIKNFKLAQPNTLIIIHRNKKYKEEFIKEFKTIREQTYGTSKIIFGKILF